MDATDAPPGGTYGTPAAAAPPTPALAWPLWLAPPPPPSLADASSPGRSCAPLTAS